MPKTSNRLESTEPSRFPHCHLLTLCGVDHLISGRNPSNKKGTKGVTQQLGLSSNRHPKMGVHLLLFVPAKGAAKTKHGHSILGAPSLGVWRPEWPGGQPVAPPCNRTTSCDWCLTGKIEQGHAVGARPTRLNQQGLMHLVK